ncbi:MULTISPECIES: MBL fold metallo-hydrolase [unclassified Thioalkalivibrio]|uniref:MBL fold metallo-hydrolase n=1 Tax=unclassified Thioalkalivibrio TaxID=2621013 RepID=UPI0003A04423|nr:MULTISPECIES: MBL fold metallo-hydrolase [unclassified Thioalkalivibrio]
MSRWTGLGVLALVVSAVALPQASIAGESDAAAPEDYAMTPEAVAPGVYAVMTPARDLPSRENLGWNANMAFVVTDDGVLVFDTGSSETMGVALREAIAEVTDQPVRWIVNSHSHGDHWLGNHAFADSDPEIMAGSAATARMETEAEGWVENFREMTEGATGDTTPLLPNVAVDERITRDLGGTEVVILPSGGAHSPGDLSIWLPQTRVLLAGDVVYSDRAPSVWDGDVAQWIDLLDELIALEPAVVVPGHGRLEDAQTLARLQRYLVTLWEAIEEGVEQGLAAFETVPLVRERMGDLIDYYPGFDDKIDRSVATTYPDVEAAVF